jgi:uncharacterized membrane protein
MKQVLQAAAQSAIATALFAGVLALFGEHWGLSYVIYFVVMWGFFVRFAFQEKTRGRREE